MTEQSERERVAGDLLRLARVKAGLTQAQLAEQAGVAQTLISAYENGHRQPTMPRLLSLLEAAGLELRLRLEPLAFRARQRPSGRRVVLLRSEIGGRASRLRWRLVVGDAGSLPVSYR